MRGVYPTYTYAEDVEQSRYPRVQGLPTLFKEVGLTDTFVGDIPDTFCFVLGGLGHRELHTIENKRDYLRLFLYPHPDE